MKSSTTASFRRSLQELPPRIRKLARKNFLLWLRDARHPSLQFKKAGHYWSARVGLEYRALAKIEGDKVMWFWIGSHGEYERLISD